MRTPLSPRGMNLTSSYNGLDDRYHALIVTSLHYLQKIDLLDEGFHGEATPAMGRTPAFI